ncbi:MAG TPA: carboxypeptidase regulatory-like domain-containing protein, partial [Candidatus Baltobacteraceae bacterium]
MFAALFAVCCLVSGFVHAPGGAPISDARITLTGPQSAQTASDAAGHFSIQTGPGTYRVDAVRRGYAPLTVSPIAVNADVTLDIALEPADSPQLRTIGSVTVNGRLARISGAVSSVTLTRADMERTGIDRVSEGLLDVPSLDLQYPHNGGSAGLATVSLRGPDPSETLLTLDGQVLNDANTGDVDVSQLPVAAFSSIDVSEGLGPQDLEGSSTIGGAVNLISLRPTRAPHATYSASVGSFGQSEAWLNATGTQGKLGYAFAADDQQERGYVNEDDVVCAFDYSICGPEHLGSSISQRSILANLTYAFSQNADAGARVFALGDVRDQSAGVAGVDAATGQIVGPGPQMFGQAIRAYDVHARTVLGAGEIVANVSRSDDNVDVSGSGIANPLYDLSHADMRTNESLQWGRTFANSSFAFGGYLRQETFTAPGTLPQLSQNIASYFARGAWRPMQKVHFGAGLYVSNYSTFGSNLDGRFSAIYDTDPQTSVRFSIGTGFRAPLL